MRTVPTIAGVLCLLVVMPTAVLGAMPTGTTKISNAAAFFTAVDPFDECESDHLIVTLGHSAFRGPGGGRPPEDIAWLDVQVWHESGCEEPVTSGYLQQTMNGLEAGTYVIEDLTAASVDITFPIYEGEVVTRTLTFDLAWVAHGPISHVRDRNADLKLTGWDREAVLTGAVADSAGLITFGDLDYASMLLGNYVIQ